MSWIVTLKIVDCAAMSTTLPGAKISSPLLEPYGYVTTDANGQAQIYDAYDVWEWVNLTISKAGTGGSPSDPGYDPGYLDKNYVIHMNMDGTVQTVCLTKAPPEDATGVGEPIECFIVTATTGSTTSEEVQKLRALRDLVAEKSELSGRLIDAIYAEYAAFSPAIAAKLQKGQGPRDLVLSAIVRPLFIWYTTAGALALTGKSPEAAIGQLASACDNGLPSDVVLGLLTTLRDGGPLPDFVLDIMGDAPDFIGKSHFATWALLDPLIRIWRLAANNQDLTEEIADWLANAPLEKLVPPAKSKLEEQLGIIADFLAFAPQKRALLGKRLISAWPHSASALAHAGMVASDTVFEEL